MWSTAASGRIGCARSGALSEPAPPSPDEIEVSLIGPGYGESVLVHLGNGDWMIVDSCVGEDRTPVALGYLHRLGVDPAEAVKMIVATHWHDDHIRGMSELVELCPSARFCCAWALGSKEFLSATAGLARKDFSEVGYGIREVHSVFSRLGSRESRPVWAGPNRRVFRSGSSEVWSLSPGDDLFERFLRSVEGWVSSDNQTAKRSPSPSPNHLSVVLWVRCGDAIALLGGDLERRGWTAVLNNPEKPASKASVFKVPHHGSHDADVPQVWEEMLDPEPLAVLTPWRRGLGVLPTLSDVERILSRTPHAYASAKPGPLAPKRPKAAAVSRTLRSTGATLTRVPGSPGIVRLRRSMGAGNSWNLKLFDPACRLRDVAA